jgi:O-methyltransferase involved in polyketide biosynthesis
MVKRSESCRPRACLFLAEGVLPYFQEADVRQLILALKEHMPGAEIVFDATMPLLIRLHNLRLATMKVKARLAWGISDARALETWDADIRLCEAWHYFDKPKPHQGFSSLCRYIPPLGRGATILHYQLG